jgi:hypothetical protein
MKDGGEEWMLKQVWNQRSFPLLDRLKRESPYLRMKDGALCFSGKSLGIDTDKLSYFVLSVLWRASAREWTTSKTKRYRISLNGYEDSVRGFLLGTNPFPSDLTVIAIVCEDRSSWHFSLPTSANYPIPVTAYSMIVLGIQCLTLFGFPGIQGACCRQSAERLITLRDCMRKTIESIAHLKFSK